MKRRDAKHRTGQGHLFDQIHDNTGNATESSARPGHDPRLLINIFDADNQLKAEGRLKAEENRRKPLELARQIARELAAAAGCRGITADDVGRELLERHQITTLGPAAGAIFKGDEFEPTGGMRKSTRRSNHHRLLYVWRLRQPNPETHKGLKWDEKRPK